MSNIKGYKVFNSDWTCRGFQYKVGETFEHNGNIELCGKGFHFCQKASDCFNYYSFNPSNKVAEVLAIGLCETEGDKTVTDKITIVREITWQELLTIVNTGNGCTGLNNSGDCNSGNRNSGNRNSGNRNSGNRNSGGCNSGNRNSGDWNSGNWNSGNRNSGDWNSGNWNSGNRNSGDWNSGDCNSGDWNSGDWNSGDWNSGFFSTATPKVTLFEKETDLNRDEVLDIKGIQVLNWNYENNWWIYEENMTDKEKKTSPTYRTTGGYLKTIPFKDACLLMWENLADNERQSVKDIPNFDARIFYEITGIDVNK